MTPIASDRIPRYRCLPAALTFLCGTLAIIAGVAVAVMSWCV